jgi:hypothetical protein
MEEAVPKEIVPNLASSVNQSAAAVGHQPASTAGALTPTSCPNCGNEHATGPAKPPSYVYALGKIAPRFPSPSLEKELAQVIKRDEGTKGLTDPQVLHKTLSLRQNRYLVRNLCWVMSIEGLDTYILVPRDPADYDLLVETLRSTPQPGDLDLVIGVKGPIAPPQLCNGLMVPIVVFDHLYSFDRDAFIKAVPKPEGLTGEEFTAAVEQLFDRIMQMADNAGATDEDRALTYLTLRYDRFHKAVAEAFGRNESFTGVDVRPSSLSGTRKVLDVILSFTNRTTDVVSKQFVRVDVTEEFPYLVTKLSPYYDR